MYALRLLMMFWLLLLWACALSAQVLPQPRLSWSLDQASWTGAVGEVRDSSGNNLHGRSFNGANTDNALPALPTVNAQGTCSYGTFRAGSMQYVEVAHSERLTLQSSFSIGVWVKPRTLPNSGLMTILSKNGNYEFHLNPNGTVNWWWQTTVGTASSFNSSTALPLGQWSHVLIRFAPGDQRIYINGNLAGQASFAGTAWAVTDPLQLGADQGLSGRFFDGDLDEVRIYDSTLSQEQISTLVAERRQCPLVLKCFSDDFGRASLGDNWAVASRRNTAFTPAINGGVMRLTSNQPQVATSSTLQRLFPAAGNYIQVQFKHYAYSGSGADGMAVVFSDATVTPQPGAFGGPLGYGTRGTLDQPGFAGGWLGVGIDEYGNFSFEGGDNSQQNRPDSVAIRGSGNAGGTSGYRYIAGTPANLNPAVDSPTSSTAAPGHTYRITVDGRFSNEARVTVERDTGSGFVVLPNLNAVNVLAAANQQAPLPDNFYLSLTGSAGGLTNIHELDDLQVCATTINPIAEQIDHFDFTYTTPGLTCSPQQVVVRACMSSDCSVLYTNPVSLTLAPATGWTAQAPASLSNGNRLSFSGGSAVLQLRGNTVGARTLGVSAPEPTAKPYSQTTCSTANCQINFADSGFLFDVPNLLANKESADIELRAVRKDISTQRCVPAFETGTRRIQFWSGYSDPVTGTQPVQVNYTVVAGSAPGTGVDLAFGPGAQATMRVRYTDAGLMTLNARYAPTSGDEKDLVMLGSDSFVVRPAGLCVQSTTANSACTDTNIAAGQCSAFVAAGDPFNLNIQAVAWERDDDLNFCVNNTVTPNYRQSNIALGFTRVAPFPGANGGISVVNTDFLASDNGDKTVQQTQREVGVFTFSATPPANGYFGETVPAGTSVNIGRFTPAYLRVQGNASLAGSCGNFSYQGQPMNFAVSPTLTVTGYNRLGQVTNNYDSGLFWRLGPSAVGAYSSITGKPALDTRLVTQGAPTLTVTGVSNEVSGVDGTRVYRWSGQQLLYSAALMPSADDAPFTAAIRHTFAASSLTDGDGVCYRVGGTGACADFAYEFSNEPGSQVRLGRLSVGNANGSELHALTLPARLETWQGAWFQPEIADACTTAANLGTPVLANYTDGLAAGETTANVQPFSLGLSGIRLTAPGAGNQGAVQVGLPAIFPTWLHYNWQGQGRVAPSATATFGIYQGRAPVIFRREIYRVQ